MHFPLFGVILSSWNVDKNHWYVRQKQGRKDSIHNIFRAAAFPTISVISSTVLQYDDHFKRNY